MSADLIGPDLGDAPPLAQQLDWLDLVATTGEDYAVIFLSVMDDVGTARLFIDRDGGEQILLGVACDDHAEERSARLDAFMGHLRNAGHRQHVIDLLKRKRRVDDQRPAMPILTTEHEGDHA
jgi:hypothetical protein